MATCGRHFCCERSLRFFLDQDFDGFHSLLIFNNSEVTQDIRLPQLPYNKEVTLINHYKKYKNLGEIYRDAISYVSTSVEIMILWDDDDIFLPNHITEGVKGYELARSQGKLAYKPAKSYYRSQEGIHLMGNNLEPSIFTNFGHILKYGFSDETTAQHLQWLDPLLKEDKILILEKGTPTLIYNWGDDFPTFKTSGDPDNPHNFNNYRKNSKDHGDRIITPISKAEAQRYYIK